MEHLQPSHDLRLLHECPSSKRTFHARNRSSAPNLLNSPAVSEPLVHGVFVRLLRRFFLDTVMQTIERPGRLPWGFRCCLYTYRHRRARNPSVEPAREVLDCWAISEKGYVRIRSTIFGSSWMPSREPRGLREPWARMRSS
jgi:hypothetical protein